MFVNKVNIKNKFIPFIYLFIYFQAIDRCYNKNIDCGKYGKCIDLPSMNSYKCQCRLFYTGEHCEKCKHIISNLATKKKLIFFCCLRE